MRISIVIPAYNEQERIANTLNHYYNYFIMIGKQDEVKVEFVIVLNGCTDDTLSVVENFAYDKPEIYVHDLKEAGKGIALKAGFQDALTRSNDWIGFVDADMATKPEYFYELYEKSKNIDGIIASRYMPGAIVEPPRRVLKRWGSKIFYEFPISVVLGISYYDFQCGAKLFKRNVIEVITPELAISQWAIDLEILYLCKRHQFNIKEVPTTWYDQAGGKLDSLSNMIRSGLRMIGAIFMVRNRHE